MFSKWFHLKLIDYEVYSFPYLRVSATRNSNITSWQLTIKIINLWYINFNCHPRVVQYTRISIFISRFSLLLYVFRKPTTISLRFKNEALNISERYHGQSLFLFLNRSCRKICECCASPCL